MNSRRNAIILSVLLFIFFAVVTFFSEKVYEGGDNYTHFQIARGVFTYPHLLLDHWGKPFYTLLIAPFTLISFTATKIFITALGVFAAYFTFLICEKLEIENRILVIIFTCFAPIYVLLLNSTFTEVMFACALTASIYLILSDRYIFAAVLLSFIPFIRTEGYFLLPFFAWYFLMNKRYKEILLLSAGTIVYSIVGYFHYHDILWVISQNPYGGAADIYGHGGPFDYLKNYKDILGRVETVLFVLGIFHFITLLDLRIVKQLKKPLVVLIFMPMGFFLAFHSFLWWKGLGGSLGSIRIMVCVIPLASIFVLLGFNRLVNALSSDKVLRKLTFYSIPLLIILLPYNSFSIPFKFDPLERSLADACLFVKELNKDNSKIHYYDPLIVHLLDENPYDTTHVRQYLPDIQKPSTSLKEGTFIIWDAHFSPNEGRLPLNNLLQDKDLVMLKKFRPQETFIVLGGYEYEVYVFRKCTKGECGLKEENIAVINFDDRQIPGVVLDSLNHVSGNRSLFLTPELQYSPGVEKQIKDLPAKTTSLIIEAQVFSQVDWSEQSVALVLSIEHDGKSEYYSAVDCNKILQETNKWEKVKASMSFPMSLPGDWIFKAYVWNHGKRSVLVDDIRVYSQSLP
jgi:hypothetical protein